MIHRLLREVAFVAFITTWFAGVLLLIEHATGRPLSPAWEYLVRGFVVAVLLVALRQGWVRGVFRDPRRVEDLRRRAEQLKSRREILTRRQSE
jgi:membrane protein implicated in regulation of membrane protease activity